MPLQYMNIQYIAAFLLCIHSAHIFHACAPVMYKLCHKLFPFFYLTIPCIYYYKKPMGEQFQQAPVPSSAHFSWWLAGA